MDGIQPTIPLSTNGNNDYGFGGGSGIWLFAILALMWGGNGLFGRNNGASERVATPEDIQSASNFSALERQLNEGVAATRQGVYDTTSAIKDANYNTLGEIRDLQANVSSGFAQSQECCCNILRAIDSVNYNEAINTASINANITAQTQKVLDTMAQNKIESLQARINQLELSQATSNVLRYPNSTTYSSGVNPYCNFGGGFNV